MFKFLINNLNRKVVVKVLGKDAPSERNIFKHMDFSKIHLKKIKQANIEVKYQSGFCVLFCIFFRNVNVDEYQNNLCYTANEAFLLLFEALQSNT